LPKSTLHDILKKEKLHSCSHKNWSQDLRLVDHGNQDNTMTRSLAKQSKIISWEF
jgi:hypothetical protein